MAAKTYEEVVGAGLVQVVGHERSDGSSEAPRVEAQLTIAQLVVSICRWVYWSWATPLDP